MHHPSVNNSPNRNPLAALRSLASSVFKLSAFHSSVIPLKNGIHFSNHNILVRSAVIPAKAGIPQIPASRRNDNDAATSSVHFPFSIFNFQLPSLHLLLTLLILPIIFALDLFYFTLARPGCAACASFSGFLSTSSLTLAMINQNDSIISVIKRTKTVLIRS